MNLIGSICRTLAWSIATATIGLTLTSAADRYEQKTRWFTIDIKPATDATPALFLTNTSEGIKLERYRSGDPTQQWHPTQSDYPRAPRVTGSSPLLDSVLNLLKCVSQWGCPFTGHGSDYSLRKFVNRASGACLMFKSVGSYGRALAFAEPCSGADSDIPQQTWSWRWDDSHLKNGAPPRQEYTPLYGIYRNQGQCLAAVAYTYPNPTGSAMQPNNCVPEWYQQFRFLETAELTCTVYWFWDLCFVQGQGR
jgi:hypothetical protein